MPPRTRLEARVPPRTRLKARVPPRTRLKAHVPPSQSGEEEGGVITDAMIEEMEAMLNLDVSGEADVAE